MTLKQTSSWPPFLPVLSSPSWRWCGHGAELLRLFPAQSWTRALGKVWISSLVNSLTLVFGCTVDLDNPTLSVIPASCPSEHWIIFWHGGPYPVLFPYLTNVINDVMTASVKKWDSWPEYGTMPLHIQTPSSQHVITSLPLYHHPVWCPSGLEICNTGSVEQVRDFTHLCFLTCAHFFLLHILSWWKMKTLAVGLGFSHTWQRGVTAVALARQPKARKSWPRSSNEWSLREKGCSHRGSAVFGSYLLSLLPRAVLHAALMPPGSTKDFRAAFGPDRS